MTIERRPVPILALLGLLLAAVSPGGAAPRAPWKDPNPLPQDTVRVTRGEIGNHGGRFVLAQPGGPRTFNGMMSNEQTSNDINNLLWGSLVDYDYESRGPIPAIAKSWSVSRDSTTYTFHLRRGARFSDGTPITSSDVMFSVEVAYDSLLHPPVQDVLTVDGKRVQFSAPDSYTVVTRMDRPYAFMIWGITSLRVLPRHSLEAAFRAGKFASACGTATPPEALVSSGPWRLRQFVPGEKTVLEPNPWWFRVDARGQRLPYLDQVVFLIVPDQTTAGLKFEAGEVDAVDSVKPDDYARLAAQQKRGKYTLYEVGISLSTNFLWFNLNTIKDPAPGKTVGQPIVDPVKYEWFRNPVFRRAVSKAIDRDAMIRGPFFGHAVKNWSTVTPGNKVWSTPDLRGDDYDPRGARQLLASLGFQDRDGDGVLEDAQGHTLAFAIKTNADSDVRKGLLTMLVEDLGKVGIKVTAVPTPFNALIANLRQDFDYDAIFLGLGSGIPPDPGQSANVFRSSGLTHFWNIKQKSPETPTEAHMDELIDVIARVSTDSQRRQAWLELQRVMLEQNYFVFLPSQDIKIPVRNRLGNVRPQVVPHRILWNIERVFDRSAVAR